MRIHYVQHVPFEGPGNIERWAADRGHELTGTHLYNNESLPRLNEIDWLIIMGGPMSVHDTGNYPWLTDEKVFIRGAIHAGKVVVGICLGSQLIAAALGADVYEADEKEIGWFPVEATDAATDSPIFADLGDEYDVFHWHGDTFNLPEGATRMARTDACANQAFVYDDRVVGLQFHLESSPETVDEILENSDNLPDEHYVQDAAAIRSQIEKTEPLEQRLRKLFDNLERATASDSDLRTAT